MSLPYRVTTRPEADLDIENALVNIAYEHKDFFAATKWIDGLSKEIRDLGRGHSYHPYMMAENWRALGYRRVKYRHHLIIYRVHDAERTVVVARVMLARRNFTKITPPEV